MANFVSSITIPPPPHSKSSWLISAQNIFTQNCFDKLCRLLQSSDSRFRVTTIGVGFDVIGGNPVLIHRTLAPVILDLCDEVNKAAQSNLVSWKKKSIDKYQTLSCSPHGRSVRCCCQRASSAMECSTIYLERARRGAVHTSSVTMSVLSQRDLSQRELAHNLCFESLPSPRAYRCWCSALPYCCSMHWNIFKKIGFKFEIYADGVRVCICVCTQARMKIERSSESNVPSKSAMKFYVMERTNGNSSENEH